MEDFTVNLVRLTFFLFDKTDNVVVFVPAFVLVWCAAWAILRRLIRLWN